MEAFLLRSDLGGRREEGVLLFLRDGLALLPGNPSSPDRALARKIEKWAKAHRFNGDEGEVQILPTWGGSPFGHFVIAGIGDRAAGVSAVERAAAAAARAACRQGIRSLACWLPSASSLPGISLHAFLLALIGGIARGPYRPSRHGKKTPAAVERLTLCTTQPVPPELRPALEEARVLADAVSRHRDLANTAGNQGTPATILAAARDLAKRHRLGFSAWQTAELRRRKCGGILAVAQGSRHGGSLISLRYPGRDRGKPIVLIGKTITFDTGGISLKPAKHMEWMKFDKCGGMAVLAAMEAIARLRPRTPVVGMLAVAENMPGGNAIRPGDVIRMQNGKRVEVNNTDAEGRLVLGDALSVASRYKPAAIVDLATLTGAIIVALGHTAAGLFTTDPSLGDELQAAGRAAGEPLWPMPIHPEHHSALKSPFADLRNSGGSDGGACIGAAFLKEFVPPGVRWAHLDIAGTAHLENSNAYAAAGATLFGTRLLVEWILQRERSRTRMR